MSFVDELVATPEIGKGQYLKPTKESTLILEKFRVKQGYKGLSAVLDFYVAHTTDPDADPVGSRVAEVFVFKPGDAAKNSTKQGLLKALTNALGMDADDLRKAWADAEKGTGEIARGLSVKVTAWATEKGLTKKWTAIKHADPKAALEEGRRLLDGVPF